MYFRTDGAETTCFKLYENIIKIKMVREKNVCIVRTLNKYVICRQVSLSKLFIRKGKHRIKYSGMFGMSHVCQHFTPEIQFL